MTNYISSVWQSLACEDTTKIVQGKGGVGQRPPENDFLSL